MNIVIVAGRLRQRRDAIDAMPEFAPRKGTKDPEKQLAQVADKKIEWESSISEVPHLATLVEMIILDCASQTTAHFNATHLDDILTDEEKLQEEAVSASACMYLQRLYKDSDPWADNPWSDEPRSVAFFGFNAKTLISVMAVEARRNGVDVPLRLYWHNPLIYDPYEMEVPYNNRSAVTVNRVLGGVGITPPAPFVPHQDLRADILYCCELMGAGGLIGPAASDQLSEGLKAFSKRATNIKRVKKPD